MTRSSSWGFGTLDSQSRRRARAQRALERAAARRRKAEQKRITKSIKADQRRRKRQEAQWRRAEQRRRRADDKRARLERRKWQKQQKRQTLGGGWGPGRQRGESATARRAAHNLLTLANAIGVRFTKDDTDQLLAFADQELAGTGDDIYTLYNRLTKLTYVGRRVLGVVGQYDVEDVESADAADPNQGAAERVLGRVVQAGELIGTWERTQSVEYATALGLAITQSLGATPDAIKADQRALEADVTKDAYNDLVQMYQGKSRLWTAVHMLLHPEDRLANVSDSALARLEEETRAADAAQARLAEAQAGTGESVSVKSGDLVGWIRMKLGL